MIDRYNILIRNKGDVQTLPVVKSFKPELTDNDYKRGYIRRYFCQKSNDGTSPIKEISKETNSALSSSPYYTTTTLRWKISGSRTTIGDTIGVEEANRESIRLASERIKNLKLYLPNLFQFYR